MPGSELSGRQAGGTHFQYADLQYAFLQGAHLQGAHLEGADLRGAVGLTQEQLDQAFGDDHTTLPDGLNRPAHWTKAVPDEQPPKPNNRR